MIRNIAIVSLSSGILGEAPVRHEVEIGLAKGKKLYDKRQDIAKKRIRFTEICRTKKKNMCCLKAYPR